MFGKECFSDSYNQVETICSGEIKNRDISTKNLEVNPENFESVFLQNIKEKDFSDNTLDIRSDLANYFFNIYTTYRNQQSSAIQLLNDFKSIKNDFICLLPEDIDDIQNQNKQLHKRCPALIETIEGTLVRFDKLEKIEDVFKDHIKGIILGGSMNYGPFYNIRENLDATGSSDIDLIFIVDEDQLKEDWNFVEKIDFFTKEDKEVLLKRKDKFLSFYKNRTADILSKKFYLNDLDFEISIHIFPEDIFSNMVNENLSKDLFLNQNKVHLLRDYKDTHFSHQQCCQKSFSNKTYEFTVPRENLVDGGNITLLPSYIISNQEFYPGIYQNLISPMFSVYLDNDNRRIVDRVNLLSNIMKNRFNKEKSVNKNSKFRFSHIRQNYFSSSLINSLDKY